MWRAWRSERIVERGDGIVFGIGGLREIRLSYGLNGESERLGKLEQGSRNKDGASKRIDAPFLGG